MSKTYRAPASGVIEALGSAVRYSDNFDEIADLVIRIVADDMWREFTTKMHEHVVHESFESFVEAQPLAGIGTTVTTLRRICAGSMAALDALDRAVQAPVGTNQHSREDVANSNSHRPTGTTSTQALRRLRKDRPDLHAEVLAGNTSAHAAMVTAGFRPKTFTVRADDPDRIAATLRRQLDHDTLVAVSERLFDPDAPDPRTSELTHNLDQMRLLDKQNGDLP